MKLIVTIPAYNEEATIASVIKEIPRQIPGIDKVEVLICNDGSCDHTVEVAHQAGADFIISQKQNKGLAETFKLAIDEALQRGADIIVNTDADGQHNPQEIPKLISPILNNEADIVIGNRQVLKSNSTSNAKKVINVTGDLFIRKLVGLPKLDMSCGFRAYSREAALKMNVLSTHTYTHESLIQAQDHKLTIKGVPITARETKRNSRLVNNIPVHVGKSLTTIFRIFTLYKPLKVMSAVALIIFLAGLTLIGRFMYFWLSGKGGAHIQSLLLATILIIIAFQTGVFALLASAVGWNRKMLEDIIYRLKKNGLKNKKK